MLAILLLKLLRVTALHDGTPNPSPLELITQLQHENENLLPAHPQPQEAWVRRRLDSLTRVTTNPIRFRVDTNSMKQAMMATDSFLSYSTCFSVGQKFRRGLPANQPTPPVPFVDTCGARGTAGVETMSPEGCWSTCLQTDVVTEADRIKVREVVTILAAEVSNMLAVLPQSALTFTTGTGTYSRALTSRGYPVQSSCAADCRTLSSVFVDSAYCGGGLGHGYDVILSVTKPPGVAGVAGTGSSCAADGASKPLWIVLAWHMSIAGIASTPTATLVDQHRGFIIHEIMHGLGFMNSQFNYARDAAGNRKQLIQLKPVYGADGTTVIDEVWFFTKGRAFEVAQTYFNCQSNATGADRLWDGLPLMGMPEAGRGAHWETLIMRDDVMSYGHDDIVSSITLAAMEDLGFYLANYTAAGCMSWGRRQGCAYVLRRCAVQSHDQSSYVTNGRAGCRGDPHWITPDAYLDATCAHGIDPCGTAASAGFTLQVACPGGTGTCSRCDAQCALTPVGGRSDCAISPATNPDSTEGDVLDRLRSRFDSIDWQAWLMLSTYLLGFLLFSLLVRKLACPTASARRCTARCIAYVLLFFVGILAGGLTGGTGFLYYKRDLFEAFIGMNTLIVCGAVGIALTLFCFLELYALRNEHALVLRLGFWLLFALCIVEIIGSFFACYWVYSLGAVPGDTLESLFGDSKEDIDSFLANILEEPVSVAEGLVCMTYQKCCRDPSLDFEKSRGGVGGADTAGNTANYNQTRSGNRTASVIFAVNGTHATCTNPGMHSSLNDLDAALHDPSNENFCAYSTGAPRHLLGHPPEAICPLLELAQAYYGQPWHRTQCQADFCNEGIDGYLSFVTLFVGLLQRYAWPLGIGLAILVLLELVLACNLRTAGFMASKKMQIRKIKKDMEKAGPTYTFEL